VFLIEKFLDLLERDKNRIALMITQSMGKPKQQAMKEIDTVINIFNNYSLGIICFQKTPQISP
jgi:acyl-CoA reductase-like NAD-dependent aldehyde dehydrogenase